MNSVVKVAVIIGFLTYSAHLYVIEKAFTDVVFEDMECAQPPLYTYCKRAQHEPFELVGKNFFDLEIICADIASKLNLSPNDFKNELLQHEKNIGNFLFRALPLRVGHTYQQKLEGLLRHFEKELKNKTIENSSYSHRFATTCLPTPQSQVLFTVSTTVFEKFCHLISVATLLYAAFGPRYCFKMFYGLFHQGLISIILFNKCQIDSFDTLPLVYNPLIWIGASVFFRVPLSFFYLYVQWQNTYLQRLRTRKNNALLARDFMKDVVNAQIKCLTWATGGKQGRKS